MPEEVFTRRIIENIILGTNAGKESEFAIKAVEAVAKQIQSIKLFKYAAKCRKKFKKKSSEKLGAAIDSVQEAYVFLEKVEPVEKQSEIKADMAHTYEPLYKTIRRPKLEEKVLPEIKPKEWYEQLATEYLGAVKSRLTSIFLSEPLKKCTLFTPKILDNEKKFVGIVERELTKDEASEIERYYDFDQENDHKIIVLLPENSEKEQQDTIASFVLDNLCEFYFNQIENALVNVSPYFVKLTKDILHSSAALNYLKDINRAQAIEDCKAYKYTIFGNSGKERVCGDLKTYAIDTKKYLEQITLAPLGIDTLLNALTLDISLEEFCGSIDEILWQTTRQHIFNKLPKPHAYRRRLHTGNIDFILSADY